VPRICLNMIVRNEAMNIVRCLTSVRPLVDCAVIVDTGSGDETVRLIDEFCAREKLPLALFHSNFTTWDETRNGAIARAHDSEFPFDYLLLVDADMEAFGQLDDEALTAPCYGVVQKHGSLEWRNHRLVRRDANPKYIGVTHEYLSFAGAVEPLDTLWFYDYATGGCRPGKFERDIELLEAGLRAEPHNARYWYYLGQSFRDAGRDSDAIWAFTERIRLGGWDEETYFAMLERSRAARRFVKEENLRWALEAYNFRPSRAEALADFSTNFREQGQNALAVVFAEAAMQIERPTDNLFVETPAYTWGPKRDFSISAFYDHRKRRRGYEVTDSLITDATVPAHIRDEARRNMFFYLAPLKDFCKSFHVKKPTFKVKAKWSATNPSVTRFGHDTLMCLRTVNYLIREDGSYDMQGDDAIRTENHLLWLDQESNVCEAREIVWSRPEPAYAAVLGLEDMRIFQNDDRLMFIACAREQSTDGMAQQVTGEINPKSGQIVAFNTIVVEPRVHEKNWMPVPFHFLPILFVYRPDRIVAADGQTVRTFDGMAGINHFSGGSQLIAFNGGYLALVHESAIKPGHTKRFYQHRFAWFDTHFRLSKWSLPFWLSEKGIEFVTGLTQDVRTGNLLISYGVNDREALLATVDPMEVGYLLWRR